MYFSAQGSSVSDLWRKKRGAGADPVSGKGSSAGYYGHPGGLLSEGNGSDGKAPWASGDPVSGTGGSPPPVEEKYFIDRGVRHSVLHVSGTEYFCVTVHMSGVFISQIYDMFGTL